MTVRSIPGWRIAVATSLLAGLTACSCDRSSNSHPGAEVVDAAVADTGPNANNVVDGAVADTGPILNDILDGAVADTGPLAEDAAVEHDAGRPPPDGTFRFLTYNVAGLPGFLSGSDPRTNMPLISPLLNAFDIVVVQEDFAYHDALISAITHEYRSEPSSAPTGRTYGDGLARFSRFPFTDVEHQMWNECNGTFNAGSDCLAGKGFSFARHELAPGVEVDVYDLHMDAGGGGDDQDARREQVAQLIEFATAMSAGRAVLVAGDTNLKHRTGDEPILLDLLAGIELLDSCRQLGCEEPSYHDRVMYRSSADVELIPLRWQVDTRFVDSSGDPLSDHPAVGINFGWRSASR